MKRSMTYDTESTGLVQFKLPSSDPAQPRIIQLAAELFNDDTEERIDGINYLIRPDGWTIPADITELTGITMERAMDTGVPLMQALPEFLELWKQVNLHRIGHNESFDMRMVRIEMMRFLTYGAALADEWKAGPAFCTQGKSTKIVNAARPDGEKKKTATLGEAYKHFTGKDLEGAHNAGVDIAATKVVYFGIKKLNAGAAA